MSEQENNLTVRVALGLEWRSVFGSLCCSLCRSGYISGPSLPVERKTEGILKDHMFIPWNSGKLGPERESDIKGKERNKGAGHETQCQCGEVTTTWCEFISPHWAW
ncbi:hypothetical protein SKAU_G00012410 [Synaphobranchus kaupii]|uniref:Uncharacterized protein n=1 Tax=Synaphobranchus kaupii TaxID=118154 RepID=A0A9Q1GBE8_SYNKA|nr:hypothetical protein SKAU_G00012410 [Synaphobranchus kaupii]